MKLVASSDLIEFMRDSPEISQKAWEAFLPWHVNQPDASEPLRERVAKLEAQKDGAYLERNTCVAVMARMAMMLGYRAVRTKTAIEGWSDDWHGVVYIQFPGFQASWHFHDSQAHLFEFLPEEPNQWDGHTTEIKYENLKAWSKESDHA